MSAKSGKDKKNFQARHLTELASILPVFLEMYENY